MLIKKMDNIESFRQKKEQEQRVMTYNEDDFINSAQYVTQIKINKYYILADIIIYFKRLPNVGKFKKINRLCVCTKVNYLNIQQPTSYLRIPMQKFIEGNFDKEYLRESIDNNIKNWLNVKNRKVVFEQNPQEIQQFNIISAAILFQRKFK